MVTKQRIFWGFVWVLTACDPAIETVKGPPAKVVALFDPAAETPVVPTPNDLGIDEATGLIKVDDAADATLAEKQFNAYLRTLDGFPTDVTASQGFSGPLKASSVTTQILRVYDVTDEAAPERLPTRSQLTECADTCTLASDEVACVLNCQTELAPTLSYDAAKNQIDVNARFETGRTYAVALIGGATRLQGADGEPVFASEAFVLLRAAGSLVTCVDLNSASCEAATTLIQGETTDDARDKAITLERIRRKLKPALDSMEAAGVARKDVVAGWVFSTVKMPLATFKPEDEIIPFPNQLLMEDGKVNLPADAKDDAPSAQLKVELNKLDGFSTTASFISETSDAFGAASDRLDARVLDATQFRVVNLDTPSETVPFTVSCRFCRNAGEPSAQPDQIVITPAKPLRPGTRYAVGWLRGVSGLSGRVINASASFALIRLQTPLFEGGKSTLRSIDDETAEKLEELRQKSQEALQAMDALEISRDELVLAWSFKTQTITNELPGLAAKPAEWNLPTAMEGGPTRLLDIPLSNLQLVSNFTGQDFHSEVRWLKEGELTSANALDPNATELNLATNRTVSTEGAFTAATLASPKLEKRRFFLSAPKTPKHADGRIPVVVFQHGYGQSRRDAALLANTLAKAGLAVLSIDAPFHGLRSYCRVNNDCKSGSSCTENRCTDDLLNTTDGYKAGTFSGLPDPLETPLISGDGFLSTTNVMASRDHLRQQVIDMAQLLRVLKNTTDGIGAIDMNDEDGTVLERLDVSEVTFIGQSLGGILGSLMTAAIPEISASVLNVPGASLIDIVNNSSLFTTEKTRLNNYLAGRGKPVGTQAYEQYLDTVRWALDAADPQNYGRHFIAEPMLNPSTQQPLPAKRVFVSWMKNDTTVPNFTTELLIRSIDTGSLASYFKNKQYTGGDHSFLAFTLSAQTEAVEWIHP